MNFLLAFVDIEPWMQFGLAGLTFITLATLLWRMSARMDKRDKNTVDVEVMMRVREETLREVNKRDEQILELTRNTVLALSESNNAIEKVADRLDDITSVIEDCQKD